MRVTPDWYEQYQKRRELQEVSRIGSTSGLKAGEPTSHRTAIDLAVCPILAGEVNGPAATGSAGPLTLPWPPSGNSAVRHAKNVHYIRDEVVTYRQAVAILLGRSEPVSGTYELHLELSPPDKRRRDVDNVLKTLLDSLVLCGWLPDDSMKYMKRLSVIVKDDCRGEVIAQVKAA